MANTTFGGGNFATGCPQCRDLAIGQAVDELRGIDVYHAKERDNVYRALRDRLREIDGGGAGMIDTGIAHQEP